MKDWLQKSLILRFSKLDCLIFYTYDIVSDVVEILVQWGVRILLANCTSTSITSETVLYMLLSHKLEKCQINKNACCFLLPCQILYYIHITQRKCIGIWPWQYCRLVFVEILIDLTNTVSEAKILITLLIVKQVSLSLYRAVQKRWWLWIVFSDFVHVHCPRTPFSIIHNWLF